MKCEKPRRRRRTARFFIREKTGSGHADLGEFAALIAEQLRLFVALVAFEAFGALDMGVVGGDSFLSVLAATLAMLP